MKKSQPKPKPKLIIFASGSKSGGGSGFENLVNSTKEQRGKVNGEAREGALGYEASLLDAEVVAVVSNHKHGGVRQRADKLGIPFIHFVAPYAAGNYKKIVQEAGAEWVALSGWLKKVEGLDPAKTFNIHPALLSQLGGRFGGEGMWGHYVHEAVKQALDKGELTESGITMHFVTSEYDRGPAFFEHKVPLTEGMSTDQIAELVNKAEHKWQPIITNKVLRGEIKFNNEVPPPSAE